MGNTKAKTGRKNNRNRKGSNIYRQPQSGVPDNLDALLTAVRTNPDDTGAVLALARYYLDHQQEKQAVEILRPLEKRYPFNESAQRIDYNRLSGFSYAYLNNVPDAEVAVQRGLAEAPHSLDFYYIQTYLRLNLREYDEVISSGLTYLTLLDGRAGRSDDSGDIAVTAGHLSQLCNFVAVAYRDTRRFDEAGSFYRRAIEADPRNHFPYLNYAKMLHHLGKDDKARAVISDGLRQCRQVQELRMLVTTLRQRPTISACMIVKNEEELLPGCLDSIRDWVNEIIVVDTGSTDRTVEIAESYGARVYRQEWEGNFSKHRNYSIELAQSDWIFIIDADERFVAEDVPLVFKAMESGNFNVVSVQVYNVYGKNESRLTFLRSVRFFKREMNIRYEGIVHNSLVFPQNSRIAQVKAKIKHLGYDLSPDKMRQKFQRSKALLERQLEENPDNTFALFNYAQLLRGEESRFKPENAAVVLKAAGRVVEITNPEVHSQRHLHLMCLDQIAWTYFFIKDYARALEYCHRALAIKPNYLDQLLLHAHIYGEQKDYETAIIHYRKYLEAQAKYDDMTESDSLILCHPDSRDTALSSIGLIYELMDDIENAKHYYEETLKVNPGYQKINSNLGRIHLSEQNIDEAERYFLRQIELSEKTQEAVLGLAYIKARRKQADDAEKYFELARETYPQEVVVHIKYGRFLLVQGRDDKARQMFERARELAGADDSDVNRQIAEIYLQSNHYDEAADLYQAVLEKTGSSSGILNDLGNCFFKKGDYEQAQIHYQHATESSPVLPAVYRNLGLTAARLNQPREAILALSKYLEENYEETKLFHIIGDQYLKAGDYDSAISWYERFLAVEPRDLLALYHLSECYLYMGHKDSAILGYRRIVSLDPNFKPAQDRLAQVEQVAETAGTVRG